MDQINSKNQVCSALCANRIMSIYIYYLVGLIKTDHLLIILSLHQPTLFLFFHVTNLQFLCSNGNSSTLPRVYRAEQQTFCVTMIKNVVSKKQGGKPAFIQNKGLRPSEALVLLSSLTPSSRKDLPVSFFWPILILQFCQQLYQFSIVWITITRKMTSRPSNTCISTY